MKKSHMSFAVSGNAVLCNILSQDIKARMISRKNPEKRIKFKEDGIIEVSPKITNFMKKYPGVFKNKKLIHPDGSNICEALVPILSLTDLDEQENRLKSIMTYEYDIEEAELPEVSGFLQDFQSLAQEPDIKEIIDDTVKYKRSIETIWKKNEENIMKHFYGIIGFEPKDIGKVRTFIMYPNVNTHRMYPLTKNNTFLFFGKKGQKDPNVILSYLTHQAVHQPMFPYKPSMTKKQREDFHGFIKFIADKETYNFLTGKSYLDIVTEGENPEIMGKMYPYFLGYKYRNAQKQGLDPVQEIKRDIKRDKDYYNSLSANSKKKKMARYYEFDKISPEKIVSFFNRRRWITPYEFAQIDFDDKKQVYKDTYLKSRTENVR